MSRPSRTFLKRCFRISLRFVMLLVLTLSVATAWVASAWQQRRAELDYISQLRVALKKQVSVQPIEHAPGATMVLF